MRLGLLRDIKADDPGTWRDRTFLTFDIDWVPDPILADVIDRVDNAGVAATWFITHNTPLLGRMRGNPRFELGIHPNLAPLLNGTRDRECPTAVEVIKKLTDLIPEALGVRCHSLVQSTPLSALFFEQGLSYESNVCLPFDSGVVAKPWRDTTGIIKIPFVWGDNIFIRDPSRVFDPATTGNDGLRVVNFHPVHVFANTASMETFHAIRQCGNSPERIARLRDDGLGVGRIFDDLLAVAE